MGLYEALSKVVAGMKHRSGTKFETLNNFDFKAVRDEVLESEGISVEMLMGEGSPFALEGISFFPSKPNEAAHVEPADDTIWEAA
ncbi:hypothetical protein [Pseudodesulfovibrio pelocollis]|uniref:hypothetical protein n=1 Tax=Pseudodesulfovibrio pelocollis TaxID=3051432 RepID=UPI00255AAF67|nr:hypothetical protein [Pseudodesulfovibrio sp. SB368]